jgi:hypothetical protein
LTLPSLAWGRCLCALGDHPHGGRRDAALKEEGIGRIQNGLALCEVTGPAPAPAFAFEMTLSILQAAINLAAAVALGLGWRMDIVK